MINNKDSMGDQSVNSSSLLKEEDLRALFLIVQQSLDVESLHNLYAFVEEEFPDELETAHDMLKKGVDVKGLENNVTNENKNVIEKKAGDDELIFQATSCASFPTLPSNNNARMTRVIQAHNTRNQPFSMHVYTNNDIVSSTIINQGGWETGRVSAFNKYFNDYSKQHNIPLSDLTFVDIGANVGWFTLSMAALGVNVLAFEPMEENINIIRQSICLPENIQSGVSKRITLFGHGLGIKKETCIIYSHNINVGDGHVKCVEKESDLQIPHDYSIRGRIPVRRLDDVINIAEQGINVVVVKMDVEGYEGNVLEGGTKFFLESGISIITTEFVPKWIQNKGGDPDEFKRKFSSAGYSLELQGGDTLIITKN